MQKHSDTSTMAIDYYERSLPLKGLFFWAIGLFAMIGAACAFVYYVYGTPHMQPEPELVLKRPMTFPPLQPRPQDEMAAFKKAQLEHLATYGWLNRSQGVVRIPIQRAMNLVIDKGLPARGGKK